MSGRTTSRVAVLVCGLVLVSSALATTERFTVNAQYRGKITQSFRDIGSGSLDCGQPGQKFTVKAVGTIRHPEEPVTFDFDVEMAFRIDGSRISILDERSRLNPEATLHKDRLCEVMPFIHLARTLTPPKADEEQARTFEYRGSTYVLRYGRSERQVEVTLSAGDEMLGKFFLAPDWTPGKPALEKLRVAVWRKNVVVSFIIDR